MRWFSSLLLAWTVAASLHAQITVRASTMLDGKGGVRHNVRVTIEGSKIARADADTRDPVGYDLTGLTLMPGSIDTHVHINGHFNKDGAPIRAANLPPNSRSARKAFSGPRCGAVSPRCGAWERRAIRNRAI